MNCGEVGHRERSTCNDMEILNLDKGRGGCMGPSDSDVTFSSGDRLLFGSS